MPCQTLLATCDCAISRAGDTLVLNALALSWASPDIGLQGMWLLKQYIQKTSCPVCKPQLVLLRWTLMSCFYMLPRCSVILICPISSAFSTLPFKMLPFAVREEGPNGSQGGGAILLVIKGTAHHTFTDVVPYFQVRFSWLIRMVS